MIFDTKLRRGVMKRHLPGPKIVSFSSTSFDDFVATVKPMFFLEEQHVGKFGIANASGIPCALSFYVLLCRPIYCRI